MPGEKDGNIDYLLLFDMTTKTQKQLAVNMFKDQDLIRVMVCAATAKHPRR